MNLHRRLVMAATGIAVFAAAAAAIALGNPGSSQASEQHPDQVLEWNQIFIDTLIATNTPNSSSQRLGAIVHTAIFDAYNGIERRYAPIFVDDEAPAGASRRAAVIAAAYTALVALFPAREPELSASYAASLAALSGEGEDGGRSRERGIAWGEQVAQAVARLARERRLRRQLSPVYRWDRGRPVAADTALVWADECARAGIHLDVRPRQQHPVPACTTATADQQHVHRRLQRRQGARPQGPDRPAPPSRRRSRGSGSSTPASTGIRQRTRSQPTTTFRCRAAIGFSRF